MNTYKQKNIPLKIIKKIFLFILSCCSINGCKTFDKVAIKSTESLLISGYETFLTEDDIILAKEAAASNIKMIDALLLKDPKNQNLHTLSGKVYFSYSFGFVEETDQDRACKLYIRGIQNSINFLNKKDVFFDMSIEEFESFFNKNFQKYYENFFFAALNFAAWMNHNKSDLISLNNRKKIKIIADKFIEKYPEYYFGGGYLLLALYNAGLPSMFGGNLELAKKYFDNCIKLNERKFLPALYLYANFYAVNAQNKELFASIIDEIDNFDLNKLNEQKLPNTLIKIRTMKLKEKIDELFI